MSDQNVEKRGVIQIKRFVACFALLAALTFVLAPHSAAALDEPTPPGETPVFTLPTTCSALITTPVPETPETPPASEWSALTLTTTSIPTAAPSWSWQAPTSTQPGATLKGYGYALYEGDTLLEHGELTADVTQYSYAAPADGTYRLFVWILEDTANPEAPVAIGCEYTDALRDTTGPVITGNTAPLTNNTATPVLSVAEPDVTYAWTVNAGASRVTISNPAELMPTFTFLADGTYIFTLVATDNFGNATSLQLTITYLAPYTPGTGEPLPEVAPPTPAPEIAPLPTPVKTPRTSVASDYSQNREAVDIASTTTTPAIDKAATPPTTDDASAPVKTTAQSVQPSNQGWIILGVPWYWWLLGLAIIITAVQWYRSGAFRKPDDI